MKALRRTAAVVLLAAWAGQAAAFDFSHLDLNKIGDIVSNSAEAVGDIDEPQELEIGHGVAARLLGALPLVNNPAVQFYVNDIGLWIAMQTERRELPWHFAVVDSDAINAFAAPGGYIFITRGLFLSLRDEAELAGVLAHEIGHVLRRHHLQAIQKNAQLAIARDVASMAASSKGYNVDKFVDTGVELYTRGLDKDDEFEADEIGVVLAARAGYRPDGLEGVLLTLANINPQDDAVTLMFKTHPPAADRLARLHSALGDRLDAYRDAPRVAKRFIKMQTEMEKRK